MTSPDPQQKNPSTISASLRDHATFSWTACTDDACPIHLSSKEGAGWFPQKRRSRRVQPKPPLVREDAFLSEANKENIPPNLEKAHPQCLKPEEERHDAQCHERDRNQ